MWFCGTVYAANGLAHVLILRPPTAHELPLPILASYDTLFAKNLL